MEHLRGPLYLDVAAKGLSLAGVALMIFGGGGWFAAGILRVFMGVLLGVWERAAVRRVRSQAGPARPAPFGLWGHREKDGNRDSPTPPEG